MYNRKKGTSILIAFNNVRIEQVNKKVWKKNPSTDKLISDDSNDLIRYNKDTVVPEEDRNDKES